MTRSWTLTVEEDPESGDSILIFPSDLLEVAGWKEGDVLEWTDNKDGSWTIQKQTNC
jgi:nitrous oxide reductase accessory protein NosL